MRMRSSASFRHRVVRTTASSSGVPREGGSAASSVCRVAASRLSAAAPSKSSSCTRAFTSSCSASRRDSTNIRRCSTCKRSSAAAGSVVAAPSTASSGSSTSEINSCISLWKRSPSPIQTALSAHTKGANRSSATPRSLSRVPNAFSNSTRPCSLAMSSCGQMRSSCTREYEAAMVSASCCPRVGELQAATAR
eukprot:scaffold100751_cov30-Tisochrysis_lutea.AAC.3